MATSLWRDKSSNLHLLGSVHFLPSGAAQTIPLQCRTAYESSASLVFEARNDHSLDHKLGTLPGTLTLQKLLPCDLYTRLAASSAIIGLDLKRYQALRPFAIANNAHRLALESLGLTAGEGLESHLLQLATADGKRLVELEDINYGFRRIVEEGFDTEFEYLRMILDSLPNLKDEQEKLVAAWITGNTRELEDDLKLNMERYPLVMSILQTERNKNWRPTIEALRSNGDKALVVVGVNHLIGREGLINILGSDNFEQL